MRISLLTTRKEFSELRYEWQKLQNDSPRKCLFLDWLWLNAWIDCQPDDLQLFLVIARDEENQLVGIAPFYRSSFLLINFITYKALRFMADTSSASEYPEFITTADREIEIKNNLWEFISLNKTWDILWMPNLKGWGENYITTKQLLENSKKLRYNSRPKNFSAFELPKSFDDYLSSLSKSKRTDIGQIDRRISKASKNSLELLSCRKKEDINYYLESLLDLHYKRWKIKGQKGSFLRNPKLLSFYNKIIPAALESGWLRLFILTSERKPIAAQIGYVYDHRFYAIQEGFDPAFHPGAGNLLRAKVIENCINEHVEEYDFLEGFSDHKRRWGAKCRTGYDLFIYKKNLKNLIFALKDIWPTGRYMKPLNYP